MPTCEQPTSLYAARGAGNNEENGDQMILNDEDSTDKLNCSSYNVLNLTTSPSPRDLPREMNPTEFNMIQKKSRRITARHSRYELKEIRQIIKHNKTK